MACRRKPPHANYYPDDMTKEEFNTLAEDIVARLKKRKPPGYFYTIRRDASGKLKVVPYSEEYREFLDPAAKLLREAAALTTNADAERLSEQARRGFRFQRLLRQRRGLDGSRFADRRHHRSIRNLRRRAVRLQSRVRSLCDAARRRGDSEARRSSASTCRSWKTICRSMRVIAIRSWARRRRFAWSMTSSAPAKATAACKPRPSICRTTNAW